MARSSKKTTYTVEEVRDIITAMPWEEQDRLSQLLTADTGNAIGRKFAAILNHHFNVTEQLEEKAKPPHKHNPQLDHRIIELRDQNRSSTWGQFAKIWGVEIGDDQVDAGSVRKFHRDAQARMIRRAEPYTSVFQPNSTNQ